MENGFNRLTHDNIVLDPTGTPDNPGDDAYYFGTDFHLDKKYSNDSRPKAEDLFLRTIRSVRHFPSVMRDRGRRVIATSVDYYDKSNNVPDLFLAEILPAESLKIDLAAWKNNTSGNHGLLSRFVTTEGLKPGDVALSAEWVRSQTHFGRWFPAFSANVKDSRGRNLAKNEICMAIAEIRKADAVTICLNFGKMPDPYNIEPFLPQDVKIDGIFVWKKDTPFRRLVRRANGILERAKQRLTHG